MAEKITTISAVSDETKEKISKLSAESLPINPSAKGMKPEEVKRAFYEPIIGGSTSILKELQRIIDEANTVYGYILGMIGDVNGLPGDKKELVGTINDNIEALNEVSKTLGTVSNAIGIEELEGSAVLEWKKTIVGAVEFLYDLFALTEDKDHGFFGQIQELLNGTTLSEYIANLRRDTDEVMHKTNFLHDLSKGYKREGVVPDYAVGATILEIEGHHTLSTDEMGYTHLDKHLVEAVLYDGKKMITISDTYNLHDFGISGRMYIADDGTVYDCRNYIYFDGTRAYYHQGCENRLGASQTPAEGEVLLEQHYDCVNIFGFLNPKITGLTNANIKGSFKFKVDPEKNISVEICGDVNDPCLKIQYTYVDEDGHVFGYRSDHDYVKKTDYASKDNAGVMVVGEGLVAGGNGKVHIKQADGTDIANKKNGYNPITPKYLDYAVKMALSDCKITWTDEEKTAAKVLLGIFGRDFQTVQNEEEKIMLPIGVKPYAQISEIHGMDSKYHVMGGLFNPVQNYPVSFVTNQGKVLFEMPSDVLTRLTDFGYRGNYIYFDNGKAFYHQVNRAYDPYANGGNGDGYYNTPLEEGEEVVYRIDYSIVIIKLATPVITDISDYITTDGIIDIGDDEYITVVPYASEEEVKASTSFDGSEHYKFNFPTVKIIVETYGGNV